MSEEKRPERKGGLGRGIGSLIPGGDRDAVDVFFTNTSAIPLVEVPGARFVEIDPNEIVPNPQQPRSVFEPEAFAELVHSIKEFGVLQPIVVRSKGSGFELIMGERRLRASKEAGLKKIPAIVRETADENMLRDALLENLHRSNLNPLEEASAYQQLLEDFGSTQEQLADKLGRSRPQITNTLRLLKLPVTVQSKVAAGVLSAGHARALLGAPNELTMTAFAEKTVREGLSVRSLEELVSTVKVKPKPGGKIIPGGKTDMLKEMAEEMGNALDTVVKIQLGRKKGQLIIEFGNVADLRRISDRIQGKN
jgi:ParB family chromosome partitioning protein